MTPKPTDFGASGFSLYEGLPRFVVLRTSLLYFIHVTGIDKCAVAQGNTNYMNKVQQTSAKNNEAREALVK
jgi:hypothetical protein